MIGDSDVDILVAKNYQIKSIGARWCPYVKRMGMHGEKQDPTYFADSTLACLGIINDHLKSIN